MGLRSSLVLAAFLAGCTTTVSPTRVVSTPVGPASAGSASAGALPDFLPTPSVPPPWDDGPATPRCDEFGSRGGLDNDNANPGASTVLRVHGVAPNQRFEVWQSGFVDSRDCSWHPRDVGGVKLGETLSDAFGNVAFPFRVADIPAGRPEAERALWLVSATQGDPIIVAAKWTGAVRTRLAGGLFGADGRPYTGSATVAAYFYAEDGLGRWLVDERKTTAVAGRYAFESVPAPVHVQMYVYDGNWLLSTAEAHPDFFVGQWRGHPESDAHPWEHPFGSPVVVNFGPSDLIRDDIGNGDPIPRWNEPSTPPSPAPTVDPNMDGPSCQIGSPIGDFRGDIDNPLAIGSGDRTMLRVPNLPPNMTFDIWQAGSMAGNKMPCVGAAYFGGVPIGRGRSDQNGRLIQPLVLTDIAHMPFFESTIWLVWPDGLTQTPVARWANVLPSRVFGKLYGEDGKPFLEQVRIDLKAKFDERFVERSIDASDGSYEFADVPLPADVEIDVFRGDRRLARYQTGASQTNTLAYPMGRPNGIVMPPGAPLEVDFGGPSTTEQPRAIGFPLVLPL